MMTHIPNILTLLRIMACPVLIVLLSDERYGASLALAAAAGVSDALDGFLAKRFNCVSRLGTLLDPLADKLLIISAMVMLTFSGDIPLWLFVGIVFRDLIIIGGWLILTTLHTEVHMRPSFVSKVNTTLLIVLILATLINLEGTMPVATWIITGLIIGVAATTALSLAHYLWIWAIRRGPDAVGDLRRDTAE